jgi:hypothetical protein
MAKHRFFWREIVRIWAQWFGVGLASIPAGITLGILLRNGIARKEALEIALSLGFVLALVFWILIGRMFAVKPIEYVMGAMVAPRVRSLAPQRIHPPAAAQLGNGHGLNRLIAGISSRQSLGTL